MCPGGKTLFANPERILSGRCLFVETRENTLFFFLHSSPRAARGSPHDHIPVLAPLAHEDGVRLALVVRLERQHVDRADEAREDRVRVHFAAGGDDDAALRLRAAGNGDEPPLSLPQGVDSAPAAPKEKGVTPPQDQIR